MADNPLRYIARELDAEARLSYVRNRWYDPELGRFISQDPIGLEGGINWYAYAENNPVNFIDPYGLECQTAVMKIQALGLTGKDKCKDGSGKNPNPSCRGSCSGPPSTPGPTGPGGGGGGGPSGPGSTPPAEPEPKARGQQVREQSCSLQSIVGAGVSGGVTGGLAGMVTGGVAGFKVGGFVGLLVAPPGVNLGTGTLGAVAGGVGSAAWGGVVGFGSGFIAGAGWKVSFCAVPQMWQFTNM